MTAHKPRKAIIAGAGIGGLTAAAALRTVGLDVEIYERAKELRPAGGALSLMTNGVLALKTLGLEPKFEEYSFLTPKDVAGEAFIVTIRYLLTLYDGSGGRVDSFTYTGYGREKARTLGGKEPLAVATQRAMRDAGAKVAVELTDQEAVRLLLRNPADPMPAKPAVQLSPVSGQPPASATPPSPTASPAPAEETAPPASEKPAPADETPPPAEEDSPPPSTC